MSLEELYPRYVIAQVASATSFFEVVDTHAPFLQTFALPDPEDYKKDKFSVSLTVFSKDKDVKSTHLRTFLDKKELLLLVDQMSKGVKGQPNEDGTFKPILDSKKGSPDRNYPEWEFTSRCLTVTYQTLKSGVPGYVFQIKIQEGKEIGQGLVAPTGSKEGAKSALIALPIMPSDKGNPPSGLQLASQVKNYLQAREETRQALWRESVKALKMKADKDEAAAEKWNEFVRSYGK